MSNEPERQHPKEDEMSEPIGVGDWVECVDAEPRENGPCGLQLAALYRIHRVLTTDDYEPWVELPGGDPGVELVEVEQVDANGYRLAFCTDRFKPIFRPSESLFLTRLMDVPADPEQVTA